MTTIAFNTLKFVNRLKSVDIPERQAEAHAEVMEEVLSSATEGLATNADIQDVRGEMRELRSELKGEMLELRNELKGEMLGLRNELKGEVLELRSEIREVRSEVHALDSKMDSIRWVLLIIAVVVIAPFIKSFF
uniref:DUF1640 domain-containing protein n=2 Tax=unclassified Candidatus Kentrum TaxID=2643149 RepID=A0A451AX14_9GAMM|nr:MAG: Protein of unknown function (DUF1640) [Candidatus Kentron sp. LPFa]VFK25830.1 MAG: Protein of unknown function (DUF1640) [Candidatus Kentron sp. LPFa]VFK65953.1 MAG: Protein of unknown function (DUF1640) [Candidatus Kentron sp. UNK]VFK70593.1 MAG: Protein of unknown function (DUF1640) [Candidatus Kentron sp. UNK]